MSMSNYIRKALLKGSTVRKVGKETKESDEKSGLKIPEVSKKKYKVTEGGVVGFGSYIEKSEEAIK